MFSSVKCVHLQNSLRDPVSTSCGHWFCRQCITSYWDQSASSGHSSCPQCGKRSRARAGPQTASQSSSVRSKTEHLSAVIISEKRDLCCVILFYLFNLYLTRKSLKIGNIVHTFLPIFTKFGIDDPQNEPHRSY